LKSRRQDAILTAPLAVERRRDPRKGLEGVVLRNEAGYRSSIYFVELAPEIEKALTGTSHFRG